jgi:hypothetical protein
MEGPAWVRNSPVSDQSGMPSQGSLEEGYWTSRNLPWSAGAADPCGRQQGCGGGAGGGQGSSGGDGRRSAASPLALQRSDWRLPRINGPIHRPVTDRVRTKGSSGAYYRPQQSLQSSAIALGASGTPTSPLAVHDPEVEATSLERLATKGGYNKMRPTLVGQRQGKGGSETALGTVGVPEASFAVRDPEVDAPALEKGKEMEGPLRLQDKVHSETTATPTVLCAPVQILRRQSFDP